MAKRHAHSPSESKGKPDLETKGLPEQDMARFTEFLRGDRR